MDRGRGRFFTKPLALCRPDWYRLGMLALCLIVLATPITVDSVDGQINWTARTVQVLGVGSPKILSHTGGITPEDPMTAAKADAQKRLRRLLKTLPDQTQALDARFGASADAPAWGDARYFSDGTVHQPATASFALSKVPRAVDPLAPTGLIIELSADIDPRLRVTLLADGGGPILAGMPTDRVAPAGVVWVRTGLEAEQLKHVGPQPLLLKGEPGDRPGQIRLGADAKAALARNSLGGIVVVLP
jgi:hypothetical protein